MKTNASFISLAVSGEENTNGRRREVERSAKHLHLETLVHALFCSAISTTFIQLNRHAVGLNVLPYGVQFRGHRANTNSAFYLSPSASEFVQSAEPNAKVLGADSCFYVAGRCLSANENVGIIPEDMDGFTAHV